MEHFGAGIYKFFKSRKLAISLIFLLSGISVLGTMFSLREEPPQKLSFDPSTWLSYFETGAFYHSPVFILTAVFLFINLAVCTYDRLKTNWGKLIKVSYGAEDDYLLSLPFHFTDMNVPGGAFNNKQAEEIPAVLSGLGYRVYGGKEIFYGEKGRAHLWGTYITHISIILTMLSGVISGLFSYVGTVGIFEGQQADTFYNWTKKKYQALPFIIKVEKLDVDYYTPEIELEAGGREGGKKYILKKGDEFFCQNDKFVFFDFLADSMVRDNEVYSLSTSLNSPAVLFKIYRDGNFISNYWIFAEDNGYRNMIELPYYIRILSSRYLVKNSQSLLNIIEDGAVKFKGIVRPNKSVYYKGLNIYFWGFNHDEYRNFFTGLQVSYDPCLWFTWMALGGVLCGLCITFFVSYDRIWIKFSGEKVLIGGKTSGDNEKYFEKMRQITEIYGNTR